MTQPNHISEEERDARYEDATFLLENGETYEGAARRMACGLNARSLEKWLINERRNREDRKQRQMVG